MSPDVLLTTDQAERLDKLAARQAVQGASRDAHWTLIDLVLVQAWQRHSCPMPRVADGHAADNVRFIAELDGADAPLAAWGLWVRDDKRSLDAAAAAGQPPPAPAPLPQLPQWFVSNPAIDRLLASMGIAAPQGGAS